MRKNRDSRSGAFIRSKPNGLEPSPWWFWITLGWSHGLEPATCPSKVCPINCWLWHRHPHWFWRVTVFSSLQFKNCIKLKNKTTQTYSVNKNKVDQIPIAVSQIANLAVVKMSFSRFKGLDNFIIHQCLTKFQHYHNYSVINLLQVSMALVAKKRCH